MAAVTSNPVTELLFRIHPWIYRTFKGRVLGAMGGVPIFLLTTTGRKSGEPRETCLMYVDKGDAWIVAASYAGQPEHPGWYRNLRENPRASLRIRDRVVPVRARDAHGEERERLWREIVAQDEGFAVYEERTRGVRDIPVVVFEPEPGAAATGSEA
jgi:deazaflavin-dependent oxidoreductase (nitroreductase family)